MPSEFLLCGATGFVGDAIARRAIPRGLRLVVAGRDHMRLAALADELGVEHVPFALGDPDAVDAALARVPAVLHCAGPYTHSAAAMVNGCLRSGTHWQHEVLLGRSLVGDAIRPSYDGPGDVDQSSPEFLRCGPRSVLLVPCSHAS